MAAGKMRNHANRGSTKQRSLLQPLPFSYIAIGIQYVTRFLGISCFVYESYETTQYERQVQRGVLHLKWTPQQPRFHFRSTRVLRWYSISLILSMAGYIPFALHTLFTQMHFLSSSWLLAAVGNMRYVLIQGATVFVMIWIWCIQDRIVRFLNHWLRQLDALRDLRRYLNIARVNVERLQRLDRQSCVLYFSKILFISLTPVLTVYVVHKEKALERPKLLAALIFNCFSGILLQVVVVTYFTCVLTVTHYGKQINELLQYAFAEARQHLNGLYPLNKYQRNRLYCLCSVIKRLHCLHVRNRRLSHELLSIYTPSIFTYLFYVLIVSTAQLFVFYFVNCSRKAGKFKAGGESQMDKCSSPNFIGLMSVIAMLADTSVLIWGTHLMQTHMKATRSILAESSVELPPPRSTCSSRCCEFQLQAVIEEFALYLRMVHQQQHRCGRRYVFFLICGFFALDQRLIFALLQTIFNYLIILIQYDKIDR